MKIDNKEIIEKVRIVTFRGTKEQVELQEQRSQSFGRRNNLNRDIEGSRKWNENFCEVTIEDATGIDLTNKPAFEFNYENWKGIVSRRRVIPIQPKFEINEFHGDKPLWLLKAYDLDKGAIRYFDMSKINK